MNKLMFFYSLTLPLPDIPLGVSCMRVRQVLFFSSDKKLDRWKKANAELSKRCEWQMHEISVQCAKELVKLSKKKIKHKC